MPFNAFEKGFKPFSLLVLENHNSFHELLLKANGAHIPSKEINSNI